MPDIILATLNAKYIHASFGLRYLYANMGDLTERTALREFTINQEILEIAEQLVSLRPRIIGLGVYIWNTAESLSLVKVLRKLLPSTTIILGGPEVSYESDGQEIVSLSDYVIAGEADLAFPELCRGLLAGKVPPSKCIRAALPPFESVALPYALYTEEDIAHRVVYVEASRGCPFTCEFCLSSLDIPVRAFDTEKFLSEMEALFRRGVRQFKFVDRTFNLNVRTALAILDFFWDRYEPGLFVHFEMVPDRLPAQLRAGIQRFPPGALQFEVGIQTFNPDVSARISRRQDYEKIAENLSFLRNETGVHIHADLIAGLPGETVESFASGFNTLLALGPHEIQVGILKRLRGTPIIRHDDEWQMMYHSEPPYEVLATKSMSFDSLQRIRRFSKFWDLVVNSGRFNSTAPLLWKGEASPFGAFLHFSEVLYGRVNKRHGIALQVLIGELFKFLCEDRGQSREQVASALRDDFETIGQQDLLPREIRSSAVSLRSGRGSGKECGGTRQRRHIS